MIQAGTFNTLTVDRTMPQGLYLEDQEGESVLLPKAYITPEMTEGSLLDVFVYYDSEDRMVCTTETPKLTLHNVGALKVKSVTKFGAFMDWGLSKDLFVPFAEQSKSMNEGETHLVYLYFDDATNRLAGSNRLHRFFDNDLITVKRGEEVNLMIWHQTPLGFKVLVNDVHIGLIYHNEIFDDVFPGQLLTGFVKQVREDNNIDISLQNISYKRLDADAEKILNYIKGNNGVAPFSDKSDPEIIKTQFGMSKKAFKRAIGTLFKKRIISIEKDGLKLVVGKSSPRRHKR